MRFFIAIFVFYGTVSFVLAICGPSGVTECVPFPNYGNVPQWATCLTDVYIQEKSRQRHWCRDRTVTYCWYQCMCELNNQCDGPDVYPNCSCDPTTQDPTAYTTISPSPTLPPWCFSPSGEDCNWYRDCLETRYPCEDTDSGYAISYAKHFCDLFSLYSQHFSSQGQDWINAVRKCLQVELVPILRPWITKTCQEIKQIAFASHSPCYLDPVTGLSICDLGVNDKLKIFWTIKGAFTTATVESMKGLWDIIAGCTYRRIENMVSAIKVKVKTIISVINDINVFVGGVIDAIANQMGWNDKGIAFYGYFQNELNRRKRSTDVNQTLDPLNPTVDMQIILASKQEFDLGSTGDPYVNTTEAVISFANSVRNGLPHLTIDGQRVDISSMAACSDVNCYLTYLEVVAPDTGHMCRMSTLSFPLIGIVSTSIFLRGNY